MIQQSNALRRLEVILSQAIEEGESHKDGFYPSRKALSAVLGLDEEYHCLIEFYGLLAAARKEAEKLENVPRIDRYLRRIDQLYKLVFEDNLWTTSWKLVAIKLEESGILDTLDALANYYASQNPKIFLDEDFLSELEANLSDILSEISRADISAELKRFLVNQIEYILSAVRRYSLDGIDGLENAIKSVAAELMLQDRKFSHAERKTPSYKRVSGWVCALLVYLAPLPNVWDVIGAVPNLSGFWIPRIEDLVAGEADVEKVIERTSRIQDVLDEVSDLFTKEPPRQITGQREPKALLLAEEDGENFSVSEAEKSQSSDDGDSTPGSSKSNASQN